MDEEFVALRMSEVPDGMSVASKLFAEGASLLGQDEGKDLHLPHMSLILAAACSNVGNVQSMNTSTGSPLSRKHRPVAGASASFNGLLCLAGGSISVGAVLYYYDATSNIGAVLDLCSIMSMDSRASRAHALRMLRVLLDTMMDKMNEEAVLSGQLSGVNAVFLITRGGVQDVHRMLVSLRIFCLDFPVSSLLGEGSDGLALGIMLQDDASLLPVAGVGPDEGSRFYVPAIVVERFFRAQAALGPLLGLDLAAELEVRLAKLSVRSKIPTTAWARALRWMVVNLREDYDDGLLRAYHRIASERYRPDCVTSLAQLQEWLQDEEEERSSFHVLVALSWNAQRAEFDIVGGIEVRFLVRSNTAVVSHWFLARPGKSHNRRHECRRVLDKLGEEMRGQALTHGHIAGLDALFLEAAASDGNLLDVAADHILLEKLGFRKVQLEYLTPTEKPAVLVVLTSDVTPRSEYDPRLMFLPEVLVRQTLEELWLASDQVAPSLLLRQVRMQEERGVALLETPWIGVDALSGVLVDLYDDWDENLALNLYNAMPVGTVEPFAAWRALMAEPDVASASPMLAAMRGRLSVPPLTASSNLASSNGAVAEMSFELHAMVALAASASKQCEGLLLHYYPRSNTAVISNIMLGSNRKIGPILEKARDVLDRCAQEKGFLSGCNCIFLELETSQKGPVRAEDLHVLLRDAGFRLAACQHYEAPRRAAGPWSRHQREQQVPLLPHVSGGSLLLAHLGQFVPVDALVGDFLPPSVIRAFVRDRWLGAFESGLLTEKPESSAGFVQMMQSLNAVTKVPLQDLPWSVQSPDQWVYVNLGRNYDEFLLTTWYNTVFKPNFPLEDEVESLEALQAGLLAVPAEDDAMLLEIVLAVRWKGSDVEIGGGCQRTRIVENFGRNGRAGTGMLSVEDGGALAGCNAIFLETNAAQAITMEQDVMDPRVRHLIYHKMGFKLVDFPYVMPPLGPGMPKVYYLLLLVYVTPKIPVDHLLSEHYLPSVLLLRFFHDQWKHAEQYGRLIGQREDDPDFSLMMNSLEVASRVALREYPWVKSRPWTLINLREHREADLAESVSLAVHEAYPRSGGESRLSFSDDEEGPIFWEAIAGMVPPGADANLDELELGLGGAVLVQYDARSNCARIRFACVLRENLPPERDPTQQENQEESKKEETEPALVPDLVDRAVAAAHARAVRQGHLGGCSAVLATLARRNDEKNHAKQQEDDNSKTMVPFLWQETASQFGFLAVLGVMMAEGQMAVLRSDDIPISETGGLHLPAKLVVEYAKFCGEPPSHVAQLAARKFFPLAPL